VDEVEPSQEWTSGYNLIKVKSRDSKIVDAKIVSMVQSPNTVARNSPV
jgi:hypothetical protein